jgi:DNA sulfur modification protein DndD
MFINKITLEDFRIYHGTHELNFSKDSNKNVFLISGNNGFGKTTLLNSLVWCLYGKLMIDVDDKFKQEIYETGGYKKFATSNLNKLSAEDGKNYYKVSLDLTDVSIPSLPCNELRIERTFYIDKAEDKVKIFIDGLENELTREVGSEIFINDFILPKEIAKFFFFDAEKIVSLAEVKSVEDRRNLSKAYSEVLGLKKYEDLKINLEDLRMRLRKDAPSDKEKGKFDDLQKEITQFKSLVIEYENQIQSLQEEKQSKRHISEQYQEKLIREGNSITVQELNELKKRKTKLREEGEVIRTKMKDMLDLAPFAMVGGLVQNVKNQILTEEENKNNTIDPTAFRRIKRQFVSNVQRLNFSESTIRTLSDLLEESIENYLGSKAKDTQVLLEFNDVERNEFEAIYNNLKYTYSRTFKDLTSAYKNNKTALAKVIRKLADAEAKEDDLLVKEIRQQKTSIDKRIDDIDARINELNKEIGGLQKDINSKLVVATQLSKKIKLNDLDKAKDAAAERMISELDAFIFKLKFEKKKSLENRLREELNNLMHKKEFIGKVNVELKADIIDIYLFDKKGKEINKETLSKGEQQLYATALLKSLVDESNINFPVFVDSPLQKFDKKHSLNVITEFYPRISEQVVIFPLLEKELTEIEYHLLLPKVSKVFLIDNQSEYHSKIVEINPQQLFAKSRDLYEHIYQH